MNIEVERPFDAPWQARAFAMVVNLHERGLFTWEEWATALAAAIAVDPDRPYYESWLDALQGIVTERQALSDGAIDEMQGEWLKAAARTPHGMPIELDPACVPHQ